MHNFRDNFRKIWENSVKNINNCLPLVRCVFFRLLPFRRILVGNCCQNLEKGHCKIADPIPELVKLKKIKKKLKYFSPFAAVKIGKKRVQAIICLTNDCLPCQFLLQRKMKSTLDIFHKN